MSGYKTHSIVNLALTLPVAVIVAAVCKIPYPLVVIGGATFVYGTFFMSPDLDLAYNIKFLSVRGILSLPFRTYAMFFRHRGLSHSLFFGTLTRVLWLGMYAFVAFYLWHHFVPSKRTLLALFHAYQWPIIAGFSGLFLADTSHIIVDKVS